MKEPTKSLSEWNTMTPEEKKEWREYADAKFYPSKANKFKKPLNNETGEVIENEPMEKKRIVNICGVPHEVIEIDDKFDSDATHFGQIDHNKSLIYINKDSSEPQKKETLIHEIMHGILVHIGYTELANDEQFVQSLANAIYQGFEVKETSL